MTDWLSQALEVATTSTGKLAAYAFASGPEMILGSVADHAASWMVSTRTAQPAITELIDAGLLERPVPHGVLRRCGVTAIIADTRQLLPTLGNEPSHVHSHVRAGTDARQKQPSLVESSRVKDSSLEAVEATRASAAGGSAAAAIVALDSIEHDDDYIQALAETMALSMDIMTAGLVVRDLCAIFPETEPMRRYVRFKFGELSGSPYPSRTVYKILRRDAAAWNAEDRSSSAIPIKRSPQIHGTAIVAKMLAELEVDDSMECVDDPIWEAHLAAEAAKAAT